MSFSLSLSGSTSGRKRSVFAAGMCKPNGQGWGQVKGGSGLKSHSSLGPTAVWNSVSNVDSASAADKTVFVWT